jgi:DNA-3-methyladenine glycosylase I
MSLQRCEWAGSDPLYLQYHDEEWGVPVHDGLRHFEMICLEGAQAGLSWITILRKRDNYRAAFANFDPVAVADFEEEEVERLLANPGIVRNRLKVRGFIRNAHAFLRTQGEFGTFDAYIWGFVGGAPIVNYWQSLSEIPAQTPEAQAMSKDLAKRGFTFVGPTICYAYMQACGLVNDHVVSCFRHPNSAGII